MRDTSEGREVRTIAVDNDHDRAALVREAFELYASGDYTIDTLWTLMVDRGLTHHATYKRPQRPPNRATFARMLRDRYYLGEVRYHGQWHPGRHEPLITPELFERAQRVLDTHSGAGVRQRRTRHHLKGLFRCSRCHARMIYTEAKGQYAYFYCVGTRRGCSQPYVPADELEAALGRHFRTVSISADFRNQLTTAIEAVIQDEATTSAQLRKRLGERLHQLDVDEDRYLDLLGDPDWPQGKIKGRLATLRRERSTLLSQLESLSANLSNGQQLIHDAVNLLTDPAALYRSLPDADRRALAQLFFGTLYVDTKQLVGHQLNAPFHELVNARDAHNPSGATKRRDGGTAWLSRI